MSAITGLIERTSFAAATSALVILVAPPALAHHAMAGRTPVTLIDGLISGLAHPIIGLDHFAFIVAVGLLAALARAWYAIPAAFVAATLVGALLHFAGVVLPQAELVISLSVLAIGGVVMRARTAHRPSLVGLVAVAGLFHGFAYAESIFGAEPTPLFAYLAGFCAIQLAIATGVAMVARTLTEAPRQYSLGPRFAGAIIAGVGVALVADKIKAIALPGLV